MCYAIRSKSKIIFYAIQAIFILIILFLHLFMSKIIVLLHILQHVSIQFILIATFCKKGNDNKSQCPRCKKMTNCILPILILENANDKKIIKICRDELITNMSKLHKDI